MPAADITAWRSILRPSLVSGIGSTYAWTRAHVKVEMFGDRRGPRAVAEVPRATMEVVNHPLSVALFIIRGTGVGVGQAEPKGI